MEFELEVKQVRDSLVEQERENERLEIAVENRNSEIKELILEGEKFRLKTDEDES